MKMQPWIRVECNSANNVANTILQLSLWYERYESGHDEDLRLRDLGSSVVRRGSQKRWLICVMEILKIYCRDRIKMTR